MPARLISLDNGTSVLLDRPILLIGRHPECDLQLESSKISRRHCCIAQVNQSLIVRDLDSTNGIRINGKKAKEGRLKPGDELTIGNLRFQVRWDSVMMPPPQPVPQPGREIEPIPANALVSCDMPVPIREPAPVDIDPLDESSSVNPATPKG
jgi:pSer/pThr/pTyr-binding forkhead associated (FHA) protein